MEHKNVSRQDNQANDSVSARRKFLIKTSTGLGAATVMAALPIKSAWATGVVNSLLPLAMALILPIVAPAWM